jgi:hypothetical protein
MPCENKPKHDGNNGRTDHGTTEKTAASEKTAGGTTPQTQPLPSPMESEEESDGSPIEQEIIAAYHRLETAKAKQQDASENAKQCRKELDRLIRKLVAYHQPLPLFDKPKRAAPSDGNDTDFSGMSLMDLTVERIRRMDEKYGILGGNTEVGLENDLDVDDLCDMNMAEYRKSLKKTKSKRSKR